MQSERIVNPPKVNALLEKMHHEQVQLNIERLQILTKLKWVPFLLIILSLSLQHYKIHNIPIWSFL